jgi:hypothetical protein
MQGGFYFHPGDEDLSLGARLEEKAIWVMRLRDTATLKAR